MKRRTLRAIDLFSGCGGLSEGLRLAGFNVICSVEKSSFAAQNYKLNHQHTKLIIDDIKNVTASRISDEIGKPNYSIDLIAGCPPCQGFSSMRTKNGHTRIIDKRNSLIDEFSRIVTDILPPTILLENVPRLFTYCRYSNFKNELKKKGYHISDKIINIAEYGVPQRRYRLVMLASRLGPIDLPTPQGTSATVRDYIANLPIPAKSKDPLHNIRENRSDKIKKLISLIPKNGGSRSELPEEFVLECHKRTTGFKDVYGRMRWDNVAPTITTGCINPSKGRFLHPDQDRAISLREAALLQTFPPTYKFDLSQGKFAVAEIIGNALPPLFAQAQGMAVIKHINTHA